MENDPRRRRPRGRRTPRDTQKPTRPPAQPRPPTVRGVPVREPGPPRAARRAEPGRSEPASPEGPGRPGRDARGARGGRSQRSRGRPAGGQGAPRDPGDLRPGTPCLIVVDCREGEPDRSGSAALFEGFFDLETGEPRRPGTGHPRLRIVAPADAPAIAPPPRPAPPAVERLWGFECWWRPDPSRAGLTPADDEEVERSKALLRGLLRDTRRRGSPQPR